MLNNAIIIIIPVFERLACCLYEVYGPVSTNSPSAVASIIHLLTALSSVSHMMSAFILFCRENVSC